MADSSRASLAAMFVVALALAACPTQALAAFDGARAQQGGMRAETPVPVAAAGASEPAPGSSAAEPAAEQASPAGLADRIHGQLPVALFVGIVATWLAPLLVLAWVRARRRRLDDVAAVLVGRGNRRRPEKATRRDASSPRAGRPSMKQMFNSSREKKK